MRRELQTHQEDDWRDATEADLPPPVRLVADHTLDVVVQPLVACKKQQVSDRLNWRSRSWPYGVNCDLELLQIAIGIATKNCSLV